MFEIFICRTHPFMIYKAELRPEEECSPCGGSGGSARAQGKDGGKPLGKPACPSRHYGQGWGPEWRNLNSRSLFCHQLQLLIFKVDGVLHAC